MSQSIYFLGIGGTLMGSLALLAKESGYDVAGSDDPIYPPMSGQLASAGITVHHAFAPSDLDRTPNKIVIGNANSRAAIPLWNSCLTKIWTTPRVPHGSVKPFLEIDG